MITLTAKSQKNVKVNLYNTECFITYIISTQQPIGVYNNYDSTIQYQVYSTSFYDKKRNKYVNKKYAKYVKSLNYKRIKITGLIDLQIEINKVYFNLKKSAMIDARMYKFNEISKNKFSKRFITLDRLSKEIAILSNVKPGEHFGHYILTPKYQFENEQNKLEIPF